MGLGIEACTSRLQQGLSFSCKKVLFQCYFCQGLVIIWKSQPMQLEIQEEPDCFSMHETLRKLRHFSPVQVLTVIIDSRQP